MMATLCQSLAFHCPLADPLCGPHPYVTNDEGFRDTTAATWATVTLDRKKLGTSKVHTVLPDAFPGETVLVVPLPPSVWQAASTAGGARLCITLHGTCTRLGQLLQAGRGREPEDIWAAALLNKHTQW